MGEGRALSGGLWRHLIPVCIESLPAACGPKPVGDTFFLSRTWIPSTIVRAAAISAWETSATWAVGVWPARTGKGGRCHDPHS